MFRVIIDRLEKKGTVDSLTETKFTCFIITVQRLSERPFSSRLNIRTATQSINTDMRYRLVRTRTLYEAPH